MSQPAKMLADINAALDKTRYTPRYVRLLAVRAELEERAKPKRDYRRRSWPACTASRRACCGTGSTATSPRGPRGCGRAAARGERGTSPRRTLPRRSTMRSSRPPGTGAAAAARIPRAPPALRRTRGRAGGGSGRPRQGRAGAGGGAQGPARARAGRKRRASASASASAAGPQSAPRGGRATIPAARAGGSRQGEEPGHPPCAISSTPGTAKSTTSTT